MLNLYVTTEEAILATDLSTPNTIFTNVNNLELAVSEINDKKLMYQKFKPVIYNFLNILITDEILKEYLKYGIIKPNLHNSIKTLLESTIFSINEINDDVLDKKMKDLLNKIDTSDSVLTNTEIKVRINGLLIALLKGIKSNPIYENTDREPLDVLIMLNNMSQGS